MALAPVPGASSIPTIATRPSAMLAECWPTGRRARPSAIRVAAARRRGALGRVAVDASTPSAASSTPWSTTSPTARRPSWTASRAPSATRRSGWRSSRRAGAFLRVNSTLCRLLGHTEEELLAESLSDVVDDARVAEACATAAPSLQIEAPMRHRDGRPVVALVSLTLVRDSRGRARVLRLPGARHDRALPGAGRPGRQRGQAGRGPADRAHGLVGVGDRRRPRHLVRRALPHLRRDARRRDRAPTGPTSTRSTPTTAPASGA